MAHRLWLIVGAWIALALVAAVLPLPGAAAAAVLYVAALTAALLLIGGRQ